MNKVAYLLIIIFTLISCNSEQKSNKQKRIHKKEKKVKKKTVLTYNNAVSFLTKYGKIHKETIIEFNTNYGTMRAKLYTNTPLHRANFLFLINQGYFNDTYFHRVVKGFMIQGGNTDSWGTSGKRSKIGNYDFPNEINNSNFHKKGALSAARDYVENPTKRTSPFEFFIVKGHTFDKQTLDMLSEQYKKKYNKQQRKEYYKIGGTPHLDGEHTVFGELISGFDTLDKINNVEIDSGEWPIKNVVMQVKIIK